MAIKSLTSAWVKMGLISAGLMATGLFVNAPASAEPSDRVPGTYVCLNSLDPACENPERDLEPNSFACLNNPNPECENPERYSSDVEEGGTVCVNNQNVFCGNAVRFSVQDPEAWPTYFE